MSLFGKKRNNNSVEEIKSLEVPIAEEKTQSGGELIAVISAAIAAFEGSQVMSNLVIRKIVREQGQVTVWNNAGRADCMRSRRI